MAPCCCVIYFIYLGSNPLIFLCLKIAVAKLRVLFDPNELLLHYLEVIELDATVYREPFAVDMAVNEDAMCEVGSSIARKKLSSSSDKARIHSSAGYARLSCNLRL
jgi:hypothetical protein